MDFNLVLGGFALAYGLYTAYARRTIPEKFRKLAPMKKQWGDRAGTMIHIVGYTVMPIVFGLVLLTSAYLAWSKGQSP